jgi:hypothetical protein
MGQVGFGQHLPLALLACAAAAFSAPLLRRPQLADLPLNAFPFIQAHDAGTTYLQPTSLLTEVEYRFARTQNGANITQLLDCGALSFDWRPALSPAGDFLGFAHGPIFVNHSMRDAAAEVVAWANANAAGAEDSLVLLNVADCGGACEAAALAAFAAAGLPSMSGAGGCAAASDFTLGAALDAAALAGGGHALALVNCPGAPVNTYDDRRSCTGFFNVSQGEAFEAAVGACLSAPSPAELLACAEAAAGVADVPDHFACYTDGSGKNSSFAFGRLREWLVATAAAPPPAGAGQRGLLVSLQGAWAQNTQSTILSFLHDSSLLLDESRAGFNAALAGWVEQEGLLRFVNQLGRNAVCDGGPRVLRALRSRLPPAAAARPGEY